MMAAESRAPRINYAGACLLSELMTYSPPSLLHSIRPCNPLGGFSSRRAFQLCKPGPHPGRELLAFLARQTQRIKAVPVMEAE